MATGLDVDWGRVVWWLFGVALAIAALWVVYRFIGTFVFGVFLYYATRPVYKRVRRRVDQPSVAAATSLTLLVLPALLLVGYTIAIAFNEFQKFARGAGDLAGELELGEYEPLLEPYLEAFQLVNQPQELLAGGGVAIASDIVLTSLRYLGTISLFLLHLFVIVAVAFYLLRDDHRLARWFRTRFSDQRGVLDEYLRTVDRDFNNIFFGNILNAIITGTIGAIVYTVLNLGSPPGLAIPYAALVGLLTGVASLVPVVGMKLVYFPVGIYLFAVPLVSQRPEVMWFPIVFAAVSFVVVDTVPDLVLRPYVSGRSLHIGTLMLAYVLGPLLFGWYGLFLAPMLLVLVVHFGRIVLPELVHGQPIKPYAVDPTYLAGEGAAGGALPPPSEPEPEPEPEPESELTSDDRDSAADERGAGDGEPGVAGTPESADGDGG